MTVERVYPRKSLRCPALVALPGAKPVPARTVDVSLGGLCVFLTNQIPAGQTCKVAFETPINGKVRRIVASAKVVYSILSGTDGFRTGLQFTGLDAENNKALAELMI